MAVVKRIGVVSIETLSGSYRLRYRVNDKLTSFTLQGGITTAVLLKAERLALQISNDIEDGVYDISKAKYDPKQKVKAESKVHNLISIWKEYKKANDYRVSPTTYDREWKQLERCLAKVPNELFNLDKAHLLIPELLKHYAESTVRVACSTALSPCMKWAVRTGLIDKEPNYQYLTYKRSNKPKNTFTVEEVKEILEAFKVQHPYYYNYVKFLALTGRRSEDIKALEWGDVEGDILYIQRAYCFGYLKTTKNSKITAYPLNEEMLEVLANTPKISDKLIFPSHLADTYIDHGSFHSYRWEPLVKNLVEQGKVKTYYGINHLRHTRATQLLRAGIDPETISYLLETSPAMLSSHYVSPDRELKIPKLFV